ncbi:HD domain-containing protein [bacterium]|nr:MAG: HD domain-containing protein [bacterium]
MKFDAARLRLEGPGLRGVAEVKAALELLGAGEVYLVGGALRDLALGSLSSRPDLDFALERPDLTLASRVAKALGGSAFVLDEGEGAYRVAWEGGFADLVALRAPTIEEDLRKRDFTLNALALNLRTGELLDPLGGLAALEKSILIPCSPESMKDDPLRALRAYRFAAAGNFTFSEGTARQIKNVLPLLKPGSGAVSPERIRDELFKTFTGSYLKTALKMMEEQGALFALFPFTEKWKGLDQGDYHRFDLLEHSLRAAGFARETAESLGEGREWLASHLEELHEQSITRFSLLVFACLFHDIGKPSTRTVEHSGRVRFLTHDTQGARLVQKTLSNLRAGKKTARAAERLVAGHMRLFSLAHQEKPTLRSRMKFLRDLGDETPEAIILSLCDELATGGEDSAYTALGRTGEEILELWLIEKKAPQKSGPLLLGRDLLELGIAAGPEVGRILRAVGEAEAEGEISTREEALSLVRNIHEN